MRECVRADRSPEFIAVAGKSILHIEENLRGSVEKPPPLPRVNMTNAESYRNFAGEASRALAL
jgi:hypothetical protein